ncbi:MAG: hypothetical protein ABI591_03575 [Kofleriaceae bacterium]
MIHSNVQIQARNHTQAPIVRDHREQARPVVVRNDHRDRARDDGLRTRPVVVRNDHRDRGRDDGHRTRPVIVRPVVYTPAPVIYNTVWNPAPSYTYQPAIQLLAPTSLANDQLSIDVGSLDSARTLELDAAGGQTYVSQVVVYSANGTYQVLAVNQMLSAANPSIPLSIDNGSSISRIVVDGHSDWGGALSIRAL